MKLLATSDITILHNELIRYALQITNDRYNLSNELVQQVWCVVYKKLPKGEIPHIAYLKAMLKNAYFDHIRSVQSRQKNLLRYDLQRMGDTEYDINKDNLFELIVAKLQIHPKGWILLELYKRDCTIKELSQILNIKYPKLRKQISRVRKDIKVEIKSLLSDSKLNKWGGAVLKPFTRRALTGVLSQFSCLNVIYKKKCYKKINCCFRDSEHIHT